MYLIYFMYYENMFEQIHIKKYKLNKIYSVYTATTSNYHKVVGSSLKQCRFFFFFFLPEQRSEIQKSKCMYGCIPSTDSKRESVSLPFLASNGCLYSFGNDAIFQFQS